MSALWLEEQERCERDIERQMADAAQNGEAQTFYALSNSVRAIHDSIGEVVDHLGKLNHGILRLPLV